MRYLTLLLLLFVLAACSDEAPQVSDPAATYDAFGAAVTPEDAVPVQAVVAEPDLYAGRPVKLEGVVREVCQNSGCWLTMDGGDDRLVRVHVPRDEAGAYVFTVPKDISGRRVVIQGTFEAAAETAEAQAHYAEDAGQTDSTAAQAAPPVYAVQATGVLVEKARS